MQIKFYLGALVTFATIQSDVTQVNAVPLNLDTTICDNCEEPSTFETRLAQISAPFHSGINKEWFTDRLAQSGAFFSDVFDSTPKEIEG